VHLIIAVALVQQYFSSKLLQKIYKCISTTVEAIFKINAARLILRHLVGSIAARAPFLLSISATEQLCCIARWMNRS